MKTVSMSGSLRENVGKKDAKALRKQGLVPAVLYGGEKQIHFAVESRQFKDLVFTPEIAFVDLDISGEKYRAILQDIQYHPVTDNIMHADFLEIHDDKEIVMGVPVKSTGVAPGVLMGGVLMTKIRKLKVRALPAHMPEEIVLDISKLNIGDSIKVQDVETKDYTLLDTANAVVLTVRVTRAAAAAAAAAAEEQEGEEAPAAEE